MKRESNHLRVLCYLSALTLAFGPSVHADDLLCDGTQVVTSPPTKAPAYTRDDLLAEIERLYGTQEKTTVDTDLASTTIGELPDSDSNAIAKHDKDTVGIDTRDDKTGEAKISLTEAAVVLRHESKHVANANNSGAKKDPTTMGNCGGCNHSIIHSDEILALIIDCKELKEQGKLAELTVLCESMRDSLKNACYWLDQPAHCSTNNLVCPGTNGTSRGDEAQAKKNQAKTKVEECCEK